MASNSQDRYHKLTWSKDDLDLINFVSDSTEIRASACFVKTHDAKVWERYARRVGKSVSDVTKRWRFIRKSYVDYRHRSKSYTISKYNERCLQFLEEYEGLKHTSKIMNQIEKQCSRLDDIVQSKKKEISSFKKVKTKVKYKVTLDSVQELLKLKANEEKTKRVYVFGQETVLKLIEGKLCMENLENQPDIPISNAIDHVLSKLPFPNLEELLNVENYSEIVKELLFKRNEMDTHDFFQKVGCYLIQNKHMTAKARYLFLSEMWSILERRKWRYVKQMSRKLNSVNKTCDLKLEKE